MINWCLTRCFRILLLINIALIVWAYISQVTVNVHVASEVTITLTGPDATWFGVGFNASAMKDGTPTYLPGLSIVSGASVVSLLISVPWIVPWIDHVYLSDDFLSRPAGMSYRATDSSAVVVCRPVGGDRGERRCGF